MGCELSKEEAPGADALPRNITLRIRVAEEKAQPKPVQQEMSYPTPVLRLIFPPNCSDTGAAFAADKRARIIFAGQQQIAAKKEAPVIVAPVLPSPVKKAPESVAEPVPEPVSTPSAEERARNSEIIARLEAASSESITNRSRTNSNADSITSTVELPLSDDLPSVTVDAGVAMARDVADEESPTAAAGMSNEGSSRPPKPTGAKAARKRKQ